MLVGDEEDRTTSSTSRRPSSMTSADFLRAIIASDGLQSEQRFRRGGSYEAYENLLNDVCEEKRLVKLKLLDGDFFVTEFPLVPHEIVTRRIDQITGRINQFDAGDPLLSCGSLRLRTMDNQSGIEPDTSYINPRVPIDLTIRDANRSVVPIIVIETAISEDWTTIMRSVREYFTLGVLQVVYFKLFKIEDMQSPTGIRLTQMYMIDFRRPSDYVSGMVIQASQVISFGYQLPNFATVQTILYHTRIDPAKFVGYGRHSVNQRCKNAGNPLYRLTFPAEVIWHRVPQVEIPAGHSIDYHVDLFSIVKDLIPDYLPSFDAW